MVFSSVHTQGMQTDFNWSPFLDGLLWFLIVELVY